MVQLENFLWQIHKPNKNNIHVLGEKGEIADGKEANDTREKINTMKKTVQELQENMKYLSG